MSRDFYINVNGEQVNVTKEVYDAYMQPIWREKKQNRIRRIREQSLDAYQENTQEIPSHEQLVVEIVEDHILLETLLHALEILSQNERGLIHDLFFAEKSEAAVAAEKGISKQAVNARKVRILKKLGLFLKKFVK